MIKALVAVADYPSEAKVALYYVHTRNVYYVKNGVDITVLNFALQRGEYRIDGIRVISLKTYDDEKQDYGILICHAANLRNHYRFLLKHGKRFPRFLFFFHGHEVMRINHDYAPSYNYMKKGLVRTIFQDMYDSFKLGVWKRYIPSVLDKTYCVFVSKWMLDTFSRNTGITKKELNGRYSITYNSVGKAFETQTYDAASPKEYDFVTIRSYMDDSKYAVDIVNTLATKTPAGKFLLVGRGHLFEHIKKADNLKWINSTMSHDEIVWVLNKSRYGLMPTRTDAQGLMMCEMAAFGIPVITSDIPVCHEVFGGFSNASFIDNDEPASLNDFLEKEVVCKKDSRFFFENTASKELEIIRSLA